MKARPTVLGILLLFLLGACGNAQAKVTIVVEAKASDDKRLSPELSLVVEVDGEFLGLTMENRAVVKAEQTSIAAAMGAVKSVAIDPSVKFQEVELLVSYAKNKRPAEATLKAAGLQQVDESRAGSFIVAKPDGGVSSAEIKALLEDKTVTYVEPNFILSFPPEEFVKEVSVVDKATAQTPNDPKFSELWGMKNIHAPTAWDCITNAPEVVVAVIDTGVDYKHPDLAANMWKSSSGTFGFDFFDDDDDPMDENSHGTHCAGTIAAVGNNGVGVVGVAWKTKIMALRFLGPGGSGSTSDAVDCIDWAIEHGAHVLSNSWGGGGFSQTLEDAITRAEKKGVLFVAAAGNSGTDNDVPGNEHYPSSYANKNIIAVASITSGDVKSGFSCFGEKSVDIGAPGSDILSTIPDKKYASFSGTSMATPHVAGAAVLTWANAFSSPAQNVSQMKTVRDLILKNARPVSGLSDRWGHAAPAVVKGGVLDIASLCDGPIVPPPSCCPVVAAAQFDPGKVNVKEDQTIIDVKVHLDVASEVHLIANSSATCTGSALFTTGFSNQSVNHIWVPSLRWIEVKDGQWVNFGSTVSVKLPAGDHLLRWNVWLGSNTELEFDGGSMLVQAYPLVGRIRPLPLLEVSSGLN